MNSRKLVVVFFCERNVEAIRSLIDRGWGLAEALFPEFNLKIGKSSFGFVNEPENMKSHNLYDFKRSQKKALRENEKSNLLYAAFHSLPEAYGQMSFEWLMEVECGCASKPKVDYIQVGIDVGVDGSCEVLKDSEVFEQFCLRILEALPEARYGMASIMPSKYLPGGYGIGLPGGGPDEYIWDVNAWGDGYGVKFDKLRNVHGYNFLSQSLLDQPIGAMPLKEWIFSGEEQRGVLSKFSSKLFLWNLAQGESLLSALDWSYAPTVSVRKELQKEKAFTWQDWLIRKR